MAEITNPEIVEYAEKHSTPVSDILNTLSNDTKNSDYNFGMLSSSVQSKFLQMLCKLINAKFTLDIGTFTGYSALSVAEVLPEDGKVITCDISEETTTFAKKYWDKSKHGKKIDLRLGNALETIATIREPLDFVFIDADKSNYLNYYRAVIDKVRSGGLIVVDNVLWYGAVLNKNPDEETKAIMELNAFLLSDNRIENVLLTVRDGLNVIRKK